MSKSKPTCTLAHGEEHPLPPIQAAWWPLARWQRGDKVGTAPRLALQLKQCQQLMRKE